jgi:hypothetical protein
VHLVYKSMKVLEDQTKEAYPNLFKHEFLPNNIKVFISNLTGITLSLLQKDYLVYLNLFKHKFLLNNIKVFISSLTGITLSLLQKDYLVYDINDFFSF